MIKLITVKALSIIMIH